MPSLKSRMFVFVLRHSHLLRGKLRRQATFDWNSSIDEFRQQAASGSKLFGTLPEDIAITPVDIDGLYAEWITPVQAPHNKAILYFHGGGYVSGDCQTHRVHVAKFVQGSGTPALLFDYRIAPEHPFPGAMEDALKAYRWLLADGIAPSNIVFAGDSAGGGLCLATMLAARDEGRPLPAGAVALSPWTDLACTGDSLTTRRDIDPLTPGDSWTVFSTYYVGDNDPTNSWISPLYGDLEGLPPVLVYVGDREVLFDDSARFVDKARAAGVNATLKIGEGLFHCYPVCAPIFPEAQEAMDDICDFIRTRVTGEPVAQLSV